MEAEEARARSSAADSDDSDYSPTPSELDAALKEYEEELGMFDGEFGEEEEEEEQDGMEQDGGEEEDRLEKEDDDAPLPLLSGRGKLQFKLEHVTVLSRLVVALSRYALAALELTGRTDGPARRTPSLPACQPWCPQCLASHRVSPGRSPLVRWHTLLRSHEVRTAACVRRSPSSTAVVSTADKVAALKKMGKASTWEEEGALVDAITNVFGTAGAEEEETPRALRMALGGDLRWIKESGGKSADVKKAIRGSVATWLRSRTLTYSHMIGQQAKAARSSDTEVAYMEEAQAWAATVEGASVTAALEAALAAVEKQVTADTGGGAKKSKRSKEAAEAEVAVTQLKARERIEARETSVALVRAVKAAHGKHSLVFKELGAAFDSIKQSGGNYIDAVLGIGADGHQLYATLRSLLSGDENSTLRTVIDRMPPASRTLSQGLEPVHRSTPSPPTSFLRHPLL